MLRSTLTAIVALAAIAFFVTVGEACCKNNNNCGNSGYNQGCGQKNHGCCLSNLCGNNNNNCCQQQCQPQCVPVQVIPAPASGGKLANVEVPAAGVILLNTTGVYVR